MKHQGRKWLAGRLWLGVLLLMLIPVGIYLANRAFSGDPRIVGQQLSKSQLVSIDRIDHKLWDDLLQQFVDKEGRVDYQAWSKNKQARSQLEKYFRHLSTADTSAEASKNNRLAFWINAYNALTIYGILQEYPTDSIRNHTSRIGGYNIWYDLLLVVGGEKFSLDRIEHQVLRSMDEPRIHFAIVCAARSCPRLRNRAYNGKDLDIQLNANATHFLSAETNFRVAKDENTIYLSSIFKWFGKDFGKTTEEILATIKPFLSEKIDGSMRIRYLKYDWGLNEQ